MEEVAINNKKGLSVGKSFLVLFLSFISDSFWMVFAGNAILILGSGGVKVGAFENYIYLLAEVISYVIFIRIYESLTESKLRFSNTLKVNKYIFIVLIVISYIFIYDNTLNIFVEKFTTNSWYNEVIQEELNSPITLILGALIVAPIFEEILLRGIILEGLIIKNKPYVAITISSLLFALMHGNLVQIPNAFFIGLVIGIIYYRTRSLLPCIFAHFVNNFFVVITEYYPTLYDDTRFSSIKLGLSIVIFISSFYMFRRSARES